MLEGELISKNYLLGLEIFVHQKKYFGDKYLISTSIDYNPKAEISIEFFKEVQNKIHWASHGHTAAEIIMQIADSEKDFMGLTNFEGDTPTLQEATIAKNYLTEEELNVLNRIVSMYLDYAELQALNEKTMTMRDWVNESHEEALEKARSEYKKYKNRISLNPTEVELHYLEATNELKKLTDKKHHLRHIRTFSSSLILYEKVCELSRNF